VSTAVVIGAAVVMGFRPDAGAAEWLLTAGLLLLYVLALSWLAAFVGVLAGSVESANALSADRQLRGGRDRVVRRPTRGRGDRGGVGLPAAHA
jgi:hypothetical protein